LERVLRAFSANKIVSPFFYTFFFSDELVSPAHFFNVLIETPIVESFSNFFQSSVPPPVLFPPIFNQRFFLDAFFFRRVCRILDLVLFCREDYSPLRFPLQSLLTFCLFLNREFLFDGPDRNKLNDADAFPFFGTNNVVSVLLPPILLFFRTYRRLTVSGPFFSFVLLLAPPLRLPISFSCSLFPSHLFEKGVTNSLRSLPTLDLLLFLS